MKLSQIEVNNFQKKIIDWFTNNGRIYPWRETNDPYLILVSEFLLQKTHVRKVEDVYVFLTTKYPTIKDLANADVEEVLCIIKPLGFFNRAKRMTTIAQEISANYRGQIPDEFKTLIGFRGVGKYTATAIMVFAFGEKRVIVDTNVIKVLKHELGYSSIKKRPRSDNNLWEFAQTLAPDKEIRKFNWGLLDYGSQLLSTREKEV